MSDLDDEWQKILKQHHNIKALPEEIDNDSQENDSIDEDEIEFHKLQLEGQKILLTATMLIEKIKRDENVILLQDMIQGLVIFKKSGSCYKMTNLNQIGVKATIIHDNIKFLELTIRQLLTFGFREIPEQALPIPLEDILNS